MSGMSRKNIFLMLAFFMAGSLSLRAQIYYEIHDVRHNQGIVGGDNYDGYIYHQPPNGRLNAQWKFVHPNTAPANYFQIIDKKHGRALYAPGNGACGHAAILDTDPYLWRLEDVDGRGVIFKIRNKRGDYLTATTDDQNNLYTTTTSLAGQVQIFRLVYRQASGGPGDIVPTNTAGKEILNESETIFKTKNNQSTFTIYGFPKRLCATDNDTIAKGLYQGLPNPIRPADTTFLKSYPKTIYAAMNQADYPIYFYINSPNRLDNTNNYVDVSDPFKSDWHGSKVGDARDSLKFQKLYNGFYSGIYNLNTLNKQDAYRYGSLNVLARFFIQEQNLSNGTPLNNIYLQIPIQASGIIDHNVPIAGWTTEPKVPYLVLHDPPGDASSSSFSKSKTICREFANEYTSDQSLETHAKVKLGVAGSAGLIVTTSFEFSVEFGISATAGALVVKTNDNQTCINTNETFMTSELMPGEGSDVFIGYGYDMSYGKYKVVDFDTSKCTAESTERMVYAVKNSGPDTYRKFVLTESGIRNDIAFQKSLMEDETLDERTRINAANQMNAWERILADNDSIVANANEVLSSPTFSGGGVGVNWSESITITNTSTLKTEHYYDVNAGMETVLEVAGSGFSFGFNFKTEKRYGATETQSGMDEDVVSYKLNDNTPDGVPPGIPADVFYMDVLRDGRYGTPIFRLTDGSKTSCPYEGGYQRDQPRLKFTNQVENEIEFQNLPVGQTKEIPVRLWNDSNEPRSYIVQLTGGSAGTDDVKMGAKSITGGDVYHTLTIAANGYLDETLSVTNQTAHAYPNLIISMYPECDPAITSDIKVSVYFGLTAVNDESSPVKQLSVFPNPTNDELTADFSLEESADVQFELYDMVGSRIVIASKENYAAGQNRKQMNVEQVPSGIYQLAIKTNKSVISRKVIVQH